MLELQVCIHQRGMKRYYLLVILFYLFILSFTLVKESFTYVDVCAWRPDEGIRSAETRVLGIWVVRHHVGTGNQISVLCKSCTIRLRLRPLQFLSFIPTIHLSPALRISNTRKVSGPGFCPRGTDSSEGKHTLIKSASSHPG